MVGSLASPRDISPTSGLGLRHETKKAADEDLCVSPTVVLIFPIVDDEGRCLYLKFIFHFFFSKKFKNSTCTYPQYWG